MLSEELWRNTSLRISLSDQLKAFLFCLFIISVFSSPGCLLGKELGFHVVVPCRAEGDPVCWVVTAAGRAQRQVWQGMGGWQLLFSESRWAVGTECVYEEPGWPNQMA